MSLCGIQIHWCFFFVILYSLRTDLESNIAEYDKLIHGLINESTTSNDPDNIQSDIDQLQQEIDTLTEAARIKELEWNNILYLKKMKEDMLLRIMRKKAVMEIMSSSDLDYSNADGALSNDSDAQLTLSNNNNNNNLANSKTTIELAKERCNMNSSDLAKERSSINRMHRFVQNTHTHTTHKTHTQSSSSYLTLFWRCEWDECVRNERAAKQILFYFFNHFIFCCLQIHSPNIRIIFNH